MSVRSVNVKLSLDGETEWKKQMRSVNSELRTLKAELAESSSEFRGQANTMAALTARQAGLQKEYDQQKEKVRVLTEALAQARDIYADSPEKINYYRQQLANARVQLNGLDDELKANQRYLDEARSSTDGCAHSIDEFGREVQGASKDAINFKDVVLANLTADSIRNGLAALAHAAKELGVAFADMVSTAADYEAAMAKVQTIADKSAVSNEEMAAAIIDLSNATGVSAADLADTVYNAISASVATEDAVEAAGIATQLAAAGFTDATTAIDALTTVVNAYGDAAGGMANVSDHLLAVQNLGKTSVDELASSIGKVIPVAAAYNVSLDDLSAAYAIMTKNGVATAESTTYLKAMFNELGDSGSSIGKILTEKTGKSFAQLQREGTSLYDVLSILMDAAGGEADAFNNLWSSSEAGLGALTLVKAGSEEYSTTLQAMRDATGLTAESYGIMTDTFEYKTQRMQTVMENLKIQLGDDFLPAVSTMMDGFTQIMSGSVDEGIETMEQGLDMFGEKLRELGPMAGESAALFAKVLTDNLPMLFDVAGDLISALIDGLVESMPELIPAVIDLVLTIVQALLDNIELIIDAGLKLVFGLAVGLLRAVPQLVNKLPQIIAAIVNGLVSGIGDLSDVGEQLVRGLWNGISNMGKWIGQKIRGFGQGIVNQLKDFFGIHSPASKHFPFIGQMSAKGIAVGWDKEIGSVADQMADDLAASFSGSIGNFDSDLSIDYQLAAAMREDGNLTNRMSHLDYTSALNSIDRRVAQLADSFVVVLDDGTIVGHLAPKINRELGRLAETEGRNI